MSESHILDSLRSDLAGRLNTRQDDIPRRDPLDGGPYVAMSLMQKARRRGRHDLALRSAATLLDDSPPRLWRRLCVTAYEDVGVADFDAVSLVTAALEGKQWRAEVGGEWAVASYLVELMCGSAKCRAADDLWGVCESHPRFEQARLDLTFRPLPELLDLAASKAPLPERALALWFAIGTSRYQTSALRERKGAPYPAMDALAERGFPASVVEVCREGFRKSSELLAPLMILLWREAQTAAQSVEPDDLPDEEMVGPVPCWAYDMHVREGNRAIARFLESDCETTRWLHSHAPASRRVRFFREMLFAVESSLVDRRLRWEVGDAMRRMWTLESHGIDPTVMAEGHGLLRGDLRMLHQERRHVVGPNLR